MARSEMLYIVLIIICHAKLCYPASENKSAQIHIRFSLPNTFVPQQFLPITLDFIPHQVSLVKHLTAGTLTSLTNLASSVARNLERLSLDEE